MKRTGFVLSLVTLAAFAMAVQAAFGDIIVNGGFEDPIHGGDVLVPSSTGWVFTGENVGVMPPGAISAWGISDAIGQQCAAFYTGATISQTFTGSSVDPVTFSVYARRLGPSYPSELTVILDGTPLTFGGLGSISMTDAMTQYTSGSVALGAGPHTLQFQTNGWSFIDNVSSSYTVPEPSAIAVLLTAVMGLLAYAWRKRR